MRNLLTYLFVCALLCATGLASAQQLTASASSLEVGVNQHFKVSYTLDTIGNKFKQPDFNGFQILSGPNTGSSMSWINGKVSSSLNFSFLLRAPNKGTYTIGPATIEVNGKTITSNKLTINVVKKKQVKSQTTVPSGSGQKTKISDEVFIRCFISDDKVYLGERVTATFKIYTRLNIVDNSLSSVPAFSGFWSQDVKLPANIQLTRETVNGKPYDVAVLKQSLLYPQRTGTLEIEPLELDIIVRLRGRGSRSRYGRFYDKRYTIASPAQQVEVMPLPEPRPATFSGAVGDYSMEASIGNSSVELNEAIDLAVTFRGKGNMNLLNELDFEFPTDFETYDPEIEDKLSVTASGISGKRTYKYLLIARHPGSFEIPAVPFTYFDPKLERYVELSTDAFAIDVARGDGTDASPTVSAGRKEQVVSLAKDIRYIKPGPAELEEKHARFFGTGSFYGLLAGAPALLFIFLFVRRRAQEATDDTQALKGKRAGKLASKQLAEARKLLNNNEVNPFYEAVFRALYQFASDKLNIPVANLSKESISASLQQRQVNPSDVQQLIDTLNQCEMARYAPVDGDPQTVFNSASEVITNIAAQLK